MPGTDSAHTTETFPQTAVSLSDEIPQLFAGEQESLELSSRAGDIIRLVL